jgi:hypothetical protein
MRTIGKVEKAALNWRVPGDIFVYFRIRRSFAQVQTRARNQTRKIQNDEDFHADF